MFYLFVVAQVNFGFKNKIAAAFRSSSREVFTEIMFVKILQTYAKKPVLESFFWYSCELEETCNLTYKDSNTDALPWTLQNFKK